MSTRFVHPPTVTRPDSELAARLAAAVAGAIAGAVATDESYAVSFPDEWQSAAQPAAGTAPR
jgi:hypothetical protein